MKHYNHLEKAIVSFFKERGIDVEIEPSGSRGPDVRGINFPLVAEIKHDLELSRDLHSKYWSDWNSVQEFGGKTSDYRLVKHLPHGVDRLSGDTRGWLAVIWGQLRYMVKSARLTEGWIICENYPFFELSLFEALGFLITNLLVYIGEIEHRGNIGFYQIRYIS